MTDTKLLKILANAPVLWSALTCRGHAGSNNEHLSAAAGWLLEAQRAGGGGGYAHSFHLLHGWQPAYPETTGYILPTMRGIYNQTGSEPYRDSLVRAARWLVSIQNSDGSFADLHGRPQVFDTGQVLIGFNDLVERAPELADVEALSKAANWLCSVQESDGSFVRQAYNDIPHAYYARVGAALTVAGRLLGDRAVRDAGIANLRWTLSLQQENAFFRHLSFDDAPPFLHTMVYVIEGLLDGYAETGDRSFFQAALRFASMLRSVVAQRDGIPRSQYHEDYRVANGEKCLTGLAQWAGISFRLARLSEDDDWRHLGVETLAFLKTRQIMSRDRRIHGGLPGSAPIHGKYMRAAIPNWGQKFFIDALLAAPPIVHLDQADAVRVPVLTGVP